MFLRHSRNWMFAALTTGIATFATVGCFDTATGPSEPSVETDSADLIQAAPYGCYGGPNQIFPPATCGGSNFEPGGPVSGNPCLPGPVQFTAVSDLTITTSINRGLFTAYCGDFSRSTVRSFQFTVANYITLRATTPPNMTGDYTIDTAFVPNGQQTYYWVNPLITTGATPGVQVRLLAEDTAGIPYPIVNPPRLLEFFVHIYAPPCAAGKGWLQFHKTCMDAAIIGLPLNTVLFEISVLKC